jgi:MoxR-like ATPase
MRHRLILNFQAQSEKVTTDQLIDRLVALVPTPTGTR